MRETTKLITEHLPEALAVLVEMALGMPKGGYVKTGPEYRQVVYGGHAELIDLYMCKEYRGELINAGTVVKNLGLIKRAIKLGVDQQNLNWSMHIAGVWNAPDEY